MLGARVPSTQSGHYGLIYLMETLYCRQPWSLKLGVASNPGDTRHLSCPSPPQRGRSYLLRIGRFRKKKKEAPSRGRRRRGCLGPIDKTTLLDFLDFPGFPRSSANKEKALTLIRADHPGSELQCYRQDESSCR